MYPSSRPMAVGSEGWSALFFEVIADCDTPNRTCGKSELLCPHFSAGERSPKYQSSDFRSNHEPAVRIGPFYFFSPYYHALNSCFFAQIWVIVRMPQTAANSELPCPQLSAGEMKFETATPRPGRDRGCGGAKTIHLSFGFLRASVPPWCKGFVFGCGYVAPWLSASVVQRFCLRSVRVYQLRYKADAGPGL